MKNYRYEEADDCYDMGYEWLTRGHPDKAEDLLKKAIELNPEFVYSYITLADAMSRMKRFGDAVSVIKRATRVDPDFDRLYFLMAKYSFKRGDFPAALKWINIAYDMNPSRLHLLSLSTIKRYAAAYR